MSHLNRLLNLLESTPAELTTGQWVVFKGATGAQRVGYVAKVTDSQYLLYKRKVTLNDNQFGPKAHYTIGKGSWKHMIDKGEARIITAEEAKEFVKTGAIPKV